MTAFFESVEIEKKDLLIIFDECPELFHGIELTGFVILERFSLEILVNLWPELLLQPVAEVTEEAFETVSEDKKNRVLVNGSYFVDLKFILPNYLLYSKTHS